LYTNLKGILEKFGMPFYEEATWILVCIVCFGKWTVASIEKLEQSIGHLNSLTGNGSIDVVVIEEEDYQ
jgi:hypothetical protein